MSLSEKTKQTLFIVGAVALAATAFSAEKKKFDADKGHPYLSKDIIKTYPENIQAGYKTTLGKCAKCHTPTRVFNTIMYSQDDWKRYVKRMMNKPNSNISNEEGKQIYLFLKYDQENRKEANPQNFYAPETMEKPDTVSWFSADKKPKNWKD